MKRIDFYYFIRRLFEVRDTTVTVAFWSDHESQYRNKAWVRQRKQTGEIEFAYKPAKTGYNTWALYTDFWYIDGIDGDDKLVGSTVHIRLSRRSSSEN